MILGPAVAAAQTASVPRTPWGEPDLQGVWDFRTLTPMERPDELADKQVLTAEEAAQQFQEGRSRNSPLRDDEVPADIVGNYNQFWFDPGTSIVETNRTSLIVESAGMDVGRPSRRPRRDVRAKIEQVRGAGCSCTISPRAAGSRIWVGTLCRCVASSGSTPARR